MASLIGNDLPDPPGIGPGKPGEPAESSGGPGAGKAFSQSTKDKAAEAAGNQCVYCSEETVRGGNVANAQETDHGIAKSRGGNNSLGNANACRRCNRNKTVTPASQYKPPPSSGGSSSDGKPN